jgi:hypothetical protein
MNQLGPNLTKILQEQQADIDPLLKGMIDDQGATNAVVDGVAQVILEKIAMAQVVAVTSAATQNKPVDVSKIQQGRVKLVEGLLMMLEGQDALIDFIGEDEILGDVDLLEVLREFIAYNQPPSEESAQ